MYDDCSNRMSHNIFYIFHMFQAQAAVYTSRAKRKKVAATKKIEFDPRPAEYQTQTEVQGISKLVEAIHTEALAHRESGSPVMWQFLLPDLIYDDFSLDMEETNILKTWISKFYELYFDKTLSFDPHEFCDALTVPRSENQSSDANWHSARREIISASICKKVSHFKTDSARMNFLKLHLWGIGKCETSSMKYGMKNEGI